MPDPPAGTPPAPAPLLDLHRATLFRGGRAVLEDLTFRIPEGEHTAILGPNGSGKSSLIRLLTRQDYPLAGPGTPPPVRILGRERWDVFALRAQMGIVSADLHQAFTGGRGSGLSTGREAVLSGFFASQGLFPHQEVTAAQRDRADAALALVGAAHLADQRIEFLSTGEARRVLIARALAPDPRALLLDEPTTGLDLLARHHFLQMLEGIARAGKTLILVTHHLEEVLPPIQRVILLREGRVFHDGPKAGALTPARLSALYGATITPLERDGRFSATCAGP